jgi:metal-responsive CopG/Arc/MetJ family transcriptional regulator
MRDKPAPKFDPRIIVPMPPELIGRVDDFRFANRCASRADAIRQLIAAGLEAKRPARQKGTKK